MSWQIKKHTKIMQTAVFDVEEIHIEDTQLGRPLSHPYYRLHAADWINVVAQTTDGQLLLVKQMRAGSLKYTLETPGGVVDKNEQPLATAKRELEEETGFISANWNYITDISPNPAIMSNRLYIYCATDCYLNPQRQHFADKNENIELIKMRPAQLDELLNTQNIFDNALSLLSYNLAKPQLNKSCK